MEDIVARPGPVNFHVKPTRCLVAPSGHPVAVLLLFPAQPMHTTSIAREAIWLELKPSRVPTATLLPTSPSLLMTS